MEVCTLFSTLNFTFYWSILFVFLFLCLLFPGPLPLNAAVDHLQLLVEETVGVIGRAGGQTWDGVSRLPTVPDLKEELVQQVGHGLQAT